MLIVLPTPNNSKRKYSMTLWKISTLHLQFVRKPSDLQITCYAPYPSIGTVMAMLSRSKGTVIQGIQSI